MRRGYKFENEIQKVADYINSVGGHAHKNNAERTIDGIYLKGEPFDYEIFLPEYKCVFDSKECKTDVWHMQKKDILQAENLKHCKNCGLEAYFLICFESDNVVQIDIDDVIEVLKTGKKSIHKEIGKKWELLEIIKHLNQERTKSEPR